MTKALFIRRLDGSLLPADDAGRDIVLSVKPGKELWLEARKARNPRRHRLFWALVEIVRDNTDCHQSKEGVGDYLKILAGHVESFRRPCGEVVEVPKSIAWSKMNEDEFVAFINRLMDVICTEVIPGLPESALRRELEAITEIKTEKRR